jgi:flagellar M-ring protein FliF
VWRVEAVKSLSASLGAKRLALIGGVSALVLAGLVGLTMFANKPAMGLLYTDLEPGAAKAITDKLGALNVPYELTPDGSGVLAPQGELAKLRMDLAAEQLGGAVGYELLDKQDALGTTSFLQNINHIRAMEGELARSIQALNSVQSARVHLVVPQRQLFERESSPPSAAITLKTGGRLAADQVNAIRYLVSSSVPNLSPGRISIVDQNGTLLARADGGDADSGLVGALGDRQSQIETRLREQVEAMLERVVGPGKARVEISAELDTEQVREESDMYDPDRQVVARSTTVESSNANSDSSGGGSVSVANNIPEADAANTGAEPGPTSQSNANETSEQTDFLNSRTRTTKVRESGGIKRLSVAVLVDGTTTGANGQATYAPRSPQELEQLTRLVRSAVGFDEERGDSVEVVNMRFAPVETLPTEEASALPLGMGSSDIARIVQTLVIGLLGIAALFLVVRPMLRKAKPADTGPLGDATPQLGAPEERLALAPPQTDNIVALIERAANGDDEAMAIVRERRAAGDVRLALETEIDVAQIEGKVKAAALKKVGEVVQRHPMEAASVIRQWMTE